MEPRAKGKQEGRRRGETPSLWRERERQRLEGSHRDFYEPQVVKIKRESTNGAQNEPAKHLIGSHRSCSSTYNQTRSSSHLKSVSNQGETFSRNTRFLNLTNRTDPVLLHQPHTLTTAPRAAHRKQWSCPHVVWRCLILSRAPRGVNGAGVSASAVCHFNNNTESVGERRTPGTSTIRRRRIREWSYNCLTSRLGLTLFFRIQHPSETMIERQLTVHEALRCVSLDPYCTIKAQEVGGGFALRFKAACLAKGHSR